ncbi:serine/threonine-protein kinase, partial [Rubripirellula tenax]|uniref:serine/threonine-protein kinase n=1 Tax=Rubripirellula tenax TaxID=2528015 RepID=UPI0011B781E4
MTNTQSLCITPDYFLAFLRGRLSDREDSELQCHLDTCESCRLRLETTAADAPAWKEAERFLGATSERHSDDDLSVDSVSRTSLQIEQVLQSLGPTDDPQSLGRIGGYEVTGVIGAGGMGVVLKAHERALDRIVAIKVMAPHLASSGSARKRFAREAKAAAAVIHPNVIAIHGVSNEGSLPYLVMPFVGGDSLQKRLDHDGPLTTTEVLRVGSQIAAGLAAAHGQGLVHRDIKPANILLDNGVERVSITDFGLARAVDDAAMTRTGVIAGTPQFMSPEQSRGESIDHRSDLFSLGSVLYALCTGRAPFRAETSYGVLRRITDDEPKPIREINADIPEWLCAIISKLMSKLAEDRHASADEVAELLEDCLAHVQQPTTVPLPKAMEMNSMQNRMNLVPSQNKPAFLSVGLALAII